MRKEVIFIKEQDTVDFLKSIGEFLNEREINATFILPVASNEIALQNCQEVDLSELKQRDIEIDMAEPTK